MRRTSAAVYRQIEAEGLLSRMRWEVYRVLYAIGPATAGEVARRLMAAGVGSGGGRAGPGNVSARMVELIQLGVVEEIDERVCTVTGRNVLVYDVTDNLPRGEVAKSPRLNYHAALQALRACRMSHPADQEVLDALEQFLARRARGRLPTVDPDDLDV